MTGFQLLAFIPEGSCLGLPPPALRSQVWQLLGSGWYQGVGVTRLRASVWRNKYPVSSATILGVPRPRVPPLPQRARPSSGDTSVGSTTLTWLYCPPPLTVRPPSTPTRLGSSRPETGQPACQAAQPPPPTRVNIRAGLVASVTLLFTCRVPALTRVS